MNLSDLEALGAKPAFEYKDQQFFSGYTSDLLTDVIANAPEGGILITIIDHINTVACADFKKLKAIVLAGQNEKPSKETILVAQEKGIALFTSQETQFILSFRIGECLQSSSADLS